MSDYCATGWQRPAGGQTYIYNATLGKLVPNAITGTEFTYNINHTTFDISTRNGFKNLVEVDSTSNPVTMVHGTLYITIDNSTPVQFLTPATGATAHGDNIKIAGFGTAGFTVTGSQFFASGGISYNNIASTNTFDQISLCFNKFNSNNGWYLFGLQGNFVLT